MLTVMRQLRRALPAGSVMLILAACGGTSTPTAPAEEPAATKATAALAAGAPSSVTVRGSVVDSSNRLLANANIECLGDVQCTGPYAEVSAEGHEHRVATTDANGVYRIVATRQSEGAASRFMMNANGRGYQVEWREVEWPDPACTSDQARCAITVDFRLTPVAD